MDVTKVGMASVEPKVATYTEFCRSGAAAHQTTPGFRVAAVSVNGEEILWVWGEKRGFSWIISKKTQLSEFWTAWNKIQFKCESVSHFILERAWLLSPRAGPVCLNFTWGMGYNAVQLMAVAEHAHYGAKLSHVWTMTFRFFLTAVEVGPIGGWHADILRLLWLSCHFLLCSSKPFRNTWGAAILHYSGYRDIPEMVKGEYTGPTFHCQDQGFGSRLSLAMQWLCQDALDTQKIVRIARSWSTWSTLHMAWEFRLVALESFAMPIGPTWSNNGQSRGKSPDVQRNRCLTLDTPSIFFGVGDFFSTFLMGQTMSNICLFNSRWTSTRY